MTAPSFAELRERLVKLAELLEADDRANVEASWIGDPASEEDLAWAAAGGDDPDGSPAPKELLELYAQFDGALLKWRWTEPPLQGRIELATLRTMMDSQGPAPVECAINYSLIELNRWIAPYAVQEVSETNEGEVWVIDRDDYAVCDPIPLRVILSLLIDSLGVDGWELALQEHGELSEEEQALRTSLPAQIDAVRAALGLPAIDRFTSSATSSVG